MAPTFTRRTHVVRIGPPDTPAGQQPTTFVDVEVLDAVAFRTTMGEEVILDFAGGKIEPYIVDNTGDGNQKQPSAAIATRRSHMERITSDDGTNFFDVEVLDSVAFRDTMGREWILNLPAEGDPDANNPEAQANEYNTTTNVGSKTATRRVHDEKISATLTDPNPSQYLTVTRTDMVAFRTIMGDEMIVNLASSDDPLTSAPRASTVMTPPNYNPQDTSSGAVKPPSLQQSGDKNIYVYFPPGGAPFTGNKRIAQGPLWWIRNVNQGTTPIIRVSGGIGLDGVTSAATCSATINGISIITETTPNGTGTVQAWSADNLYNSSGSLFVVFDISDLGAWLKAKGAELDPNGNFTVVFSATGSTPDGGDGGNPVDGSGSYSISASNDASGQHFFDGASVDTGNTIVAKPVNLSKTETISLPDPPPGP